ncbi:MAG TPA: YggT family protein [Anaerovoracaceae bacterium]|nr:YggT family protein [Anaerovoracaceae bacterium]
MGVIYENGGIVGVICDAIIKFGDVITFLLCARAILSWFAQDPYSTLGKIYQILVNLTEIVVAPCRNLMSRFNTGMIDFSVLIACLVVQFGSRFLSVLIGMIF